MVCLEIYAKFSVLTGTSTLMIGVFYMKELYEPWILIPVSSKSVEKYGSRGHLNICNWTLMRRPFCRLRDVTQPN